MRALRKHWVVIPVLLSAVACAGTTTTTVRHIEAYSPRTWVGADVAAVESVWGPAKSGESDGNGGRIITYRGSGGVNVTVSAPEELPNPGDDRDATGRPERDLAAEAMKPQANNDPRADAKFWVDSSGKVYRYWFSEQVWKKNPEKTAPPGTPAGAEASQH